MESNNTQLIFLLYDSIENSVFDGQVLMPLIKRKEKDPATCIIIISFEKYSPKKATIETIKQHQIELIIIKKLFPFLGLFSLRPAIRQLHAALKKIGSYCLIARGPLAGWIAVRATRKTMCTNIIIQARGVLGHEYAYTHREARFPFSFIHFIRKMQFFYAEKQAYKAKARHVPLAFEAVSPALKKYLIDQYRLPDNLIFIAQDDIPLSIPEAQRQEWRTAIRTKLGITSRSYVYCYNGSHKPWQQPKDVIQFFVAKYKENEKSFLLILTPDKEPFLKLLKKTALDPSHYYVCTVSHQDIYRYLAAADVGILFREKSIVNWVSRPTKMLEYQAVGLPIIHNNTIGLLTES